MTRSDVYFVLVVSLILFESQEGAGTPSSTTSSPNVTASMEVGNASSQQCSEKNISSRFSQFRLQSENSNLNCTKLSFSWPENDSDVMLAIMVYHMKSAGSQDPTNFTIRLPGGNKIFSTNENNGTEFTSWCGTFTLNNSDCQITNDNMTCGTRNFSIAVVDWPPSIEFHGSNYSVLVTHAFMFCLSPTEPQFQKVSTSADNTFLLPVVACLAVLLILVIFVLAFVCVKKKYNLKNVALGNCFSRGAVEPLLPRILVPDNRKSCNECSTSTGKSGHNGTAHTTVGNSENHVYDSVPTSNITRSPYDFANDGGDMVANELYTGY